MVLFLLKVLLLLVGLLLVGFQFLLWGVKKNREKIVQARTKIAIAWVILLLAFLAKIIFFR